MNTTLQRFVESLRQHEVRVSPAETLDAMQAAAFVGYEDRQLLRAALGATLAKTAEEKPVFERVFDQFFGLRPQQQEQDETEQTAVSAAAPESLEDSPMMAQGDQLQVELRQAASDINLQNMEFTTQKGLYTRRLLQAMGSDDLDQAISELREADDPAAAALEAQRERARSAARDFVEQEFLLSNNAAGRELREQALRDARLSALDQRHLKDMEKLVHKLARKIARKHRRRQHVDKRGRLDVGRTLRRNMAYGSVPFHISWKKVKKDQPKLMVLCDVSGSVATYARFLLLFLYSLSDVIPKMRSFVFSNCLGETTHLFEEEEAQTAIEIAQKKWGWGGSDYGTTFKEFGEECLGDIDHNTTVIIMGDGRCNGAPTGLEVLQKVYGKARLVLWLNPESKFSWDTGDSEIGRFKTACHEVAECNSLAKLERLIDRLLKITA